MNREQRRKPTLGGNERQQIQHFTTQWGVSEDNRIVALFPAPIANWVMTLDESEGIIEAIRAGQAEIRRRMDAAKAGAAAVIDKASKP